jgi:hypothetical protein
LLLIVVTIRKPSERDAPVLGVGFGPDVELRDIADLPGARLVRPISELILTNRLGRGRAARDPKLILPQDP